MQVSIDGERESAYLRSKMGAGRLRSYLEPVSVSRVRGRSEKVAKSSPPGAVGGRYGSGCFHFSRRFSVSLIKSCARVSDAAL